MVQLSKSGELGFGLGLGSQEFLCGGGYGSGDGVEGEVILGS